MIRDLVTPALRAGVKPISAEAMPIVAAITASTQAGPDRLRAWLNDVNDPSRERYLRFLAVVNGWQAPEPLTPALDWLTRALPPEGDRAHTPPA